MKKCVALLLALVLVGIAACGSRNLNKEPPVIRATHVDLQRYMGPWFIVGAIGLSLEKGAHNAVETYTLNPDGSIAAVFQFRKNSFDGELVTKVTKAVVQPGSGNAEWRIRIFGPLKYQYLISHLEPDYSAAILARDKRDYVWILARDPKMKPPQYDAYVQKIEDLGYDLSKFSSYPHDGRQPEEL